MLVTAFSTIVIAMAVVLIVVASMLLSSANVKKNQDQAYELATSLSTKLEELIINETDSGHKSYIVLSDNLTLIDEENFSGIPDSKVTAIVNEENANGKTYYVLTVTAHAGREIYVKETEYVGSKESGYTRRY